MSRASSKTSLSPSATSPSSNRIDLGKDSGVDLGRKSQVSATSGGIGITQEITSIGGMQVEGGVSVDVSPLEFEVSSNSRDTVSIAASAEVPGGIVGFGGGVSVDTSTGQIKGGSISGEIGGFGVEVSKTEQGFGLGVSWRIPFTPITVNIGFGQERESNTSLPSPPRGGWGEWERTSSGWEIDNLNPVSAGRENGLPKRQQPPPPIQFPEGDACAYLKYCRFTFVYPGREIGHSGYFVANIGFRSLDSPPRIFDWGFPQYFKGSHDQFGNLSPSGLRVIAYGSGGANYPIQIANYIYGSWNSTTDIEIVVTKVWYERVVRCLNAIIPTENSSTYSPPPNPPPRKQMDQCCRDSIKLLRAIYSGLGIQKFPGQLPSTIIQEVEEEGATPAEPPQEPIADFADLLMWMFHRDDERWGQWKIQIKVKDSDLTKEGDQAKQVKFPNLAESVAEIEGQLLSLQANVEALVAISVRNLTESGMARQEAIKAYLASMAIAKYMNFPYEETDVEIPSTFTPGAEGIDQLVKESTIHAKGIEYTNKETQRDILLDLLQAAAITRAVHWRQVDPKKDIKSQILENIKRTANLSERLNNPIKADGDQPKTGKDWEDFLDQVEDGFGYEAGIENAQTPYGRSRDRRPRIRQIGENIDQAGKADG